MAKSSKKLVLDNQFVVESFFEDTYIIGVVTPLRYYQFVAQVNRMLHTDFEYDIENPLIINEIEFPVYQWEDHAEAASHYLYANRLPDALLMYEIPTVDYVWVVKKEHRHHEHKQALITALKSLAFVQFVTPMQYDLLPSAEVLIK